MIVLLNPVFNCSKSLLSFSADKVTTGTYNIQPRILKITFVGLLISSTAGSASGSSSQFLDQVEVKDTSHLINGISNVLQKFLKYFNGTTILTSFFSTLLPSDFLVILVL